MTEGVEFQIRKAAFIKSYKEYLALLEEFQLSDAHDITILEQLAKAQSKTAIESKAFTNFMELYIHKHST
jgi:hypothetical protein